LLLQRSWLGRGREAGGGVLEILLLGRRWEVAHTINRLLLVNQGAYRWGLRGFFTVATLKAMASLDGRDLIARSSYFGRICSDTATFVVSFSEEAVCKVLSGGSNASRCSGEGKTLPTSDCSHCGYS
jgi:hypothetical protein